MKISLVTDAWAPQVISRAAHPAALAALRQAGLASPTQAPQDWTRLRVCALRLDVVILLDTLPDIDLPPWPGQPGTALWNYPDLAAAGMDLPMAETTRLLHSLRRRLEILVTLLARAREGTALRSDIRDIAFL